MTVMIPEEEFGHGSFGPNPLSDEQMRKFACMVRRRLNCWASAPIGVHVRWHDMLVSFLNSLRGCNSATVDYCIFWALRENQGQPYYKKARESFILVVRDAFREFQHWMMSQPVAA